MYIEPNTNIKLLRNVPLDKTYEHSINFRSASQQYSYMTGKTKYNLTDYTYQRVNNGIIRVGIVADLLYDCNYLMFQNTNFGNKWFYAFITEIEYKNNECSIVHYELDDLMSWFFDFHHGMCFVEREHVPVAEDTINGNLVPESVDIGEYVFNDYAPITDMTSMCVIIAIVDTDNNSGGNLYDGIYSGAQLFVYDSTDVQSINSKLDEYLQKPDAILSMYMVSKKFIVEIPDNHLLPYGASGVSVVVDCGFVGKDAPLDGYVPKNKKLYSYPYNFYHVDNANGQSLALRYEFGDGGRIRVMIDGTITQPVQASLRPVAYKGVGGYDSIGGWHYYNGEVLTINNYPICSWAVDSYQAWIAQNSLPIAMEQVGKMGGSLAFGGAIGASGTIGTITSLLSQTYKASIMADQCRGNMNNGGVNTATHKQQFYGGRCSINWQHAKVIDDYFTMYGYAINRCKTPNYFSRPHWNYIKTIDITLEGSVPADAMKKICDIYNNGITFWENGDEVGNYALDNRGGS